ncbi:hypothetical protein OJAV_G00154720 [Oryzias javanicus]|uniref:Uncharacterized protein n=1 Tax=Oryzias javanicus TaxID=123683 RepID=A0A437CHS3_ORYJA|nr:hypothetical protein OJAV_G00154720 [Oryzias javanicus]
MSASKVKMRDRKMRDQPASVQYSSPSAAVGSSSQNGRQTQDSGMQRNPPPPHRTGWVRGYQRDGGGYMKDMPKHITAGAFARSRAAEVKAMLKAVTKRTGSNHVFQALPKHMRRRAMSHNINRLPRRLRDVASKMREKSLLAGSKKKKELPKSKSRKARRRHGNLLLEFNRRQRKNIWLETHILHAKRFHMVKKWGYCLGYRPTGKCYRPCYRAMSSHCLLQDVSYYCCIELQGEEDKLLTALSQLTSKETGPTFAAAVCLSGCRQGSAVVYRAGQYPSQPLGPVTFLWRPRADSSAIRQLWIWVHPTLKQDLLPELQRVCECCEAVATPADSASTLQSEPKPEVSPKAKGTPGGKRKRSREDGGGPPAKKILGDGTRPAGAPVTWKSSSTGILINDLTMEMVRYRLVGPQSHTVLTETLEAATNCDEAGQSQAASLWWPEHCRDERKMNLHQRQADVFNTLRDIYSSGEVPPGTVLGLTVDDPRLTLPAKKVKAMPRVTQSPEADEEKRRQLMLRGVPELCSQSCLWDQTVRDNVTENKISEQELNRMRSELLVPGSRLSPTPPQGRVPILLVHQPGKQVGTDMSSWGAGWDLLLPKGWGMAFWVPLVYRGVRIAGLHMSLKQSQNQGAPHFPHDYPDCPAGVRFQEEQEAELLDKFKRHPPAKRTNYIKHGCLAPFCCPWQQLVEEWELLRRQAGDEGDGQAQSTTKLEEEMTPQPSPSQSGFTVIRSRKSLRLLSATSVVWVRLSLLSKGKPELHAMVCAPTPEDLTTDAGRCPQEPPHTDPFKSKVKLRKKGSKKDAGPGTEASELKVSGVWPDPLPSITSHCSRVTLGWVTEGDFSLSAGCGQALGFVSVPGLLNTLLSQPEEHRGKVLLRNPSSLHYRLARISIEV